MTTKKQIEELIEKLGEGGGHCCEKTEKPVLIGDVLGPVMVAWTEEQQREQILELVYLWHECGVDKSLQEIFEETEWEEVECSSCNSGGFTSEHNPGGPHENGCSSCPIQVQCEPCIGGGTIEQAKPSPATELFKFLISLNL